MNNRTNAATRDIVVEDVLPHSPEKVWRALTTSELIDRWLMPNDFKPAVGHRFTLKTQPMGSWDGVVHCEVLEVEQNRRLVYSWRGGADDNPKYGSKLDSIVTWTLTPENSGTRLRLVHAGFRSPGNDFAYDAMKPGWGHIMGGIAEVITANG